MDPTVQADAEYNVAKLRNREEPIATIKAVHTGPNASKASPEDAAGLEPVIYLAHGPRVMLTSNIWTDASLVREQWEQFRPYVTRVGVHLAFLWL